MSDAPRIIVVGDAGVDRWVYGAVDRTNPEGPFLLLNRERETTSLGMGGLVCLMLKALGADPLLVSCHARVCPALQDAGLDANGLVMQSYERPLIKKTRFMASAAGRHHQGVLRVDDEPEAATAPLSVVESNNVGRVCEREIPKAKAVVISDYAKGNCTDYVLAKVVGIASNHNVPVLVDPSRKRTSWNCYAGATMIKANRHEAASAGFKWRSRAMPGKRCVTEPLMPTFFGDVGVRNVVVTLDGDGFVLCNRGCEIAHPADAPHSVADVVGAGDQLLAGMAVALARGDDLEAACRFGNRAAGLQVARSGCVPVTLDDLK